MSSTQYLVGFIVLVVVAGAIVFGGVTGIYFLDKHRLDPPRPSVPEPAAQPGAATSEDAASARSDDPALAGPSTAGR